MKLRPLIVVPLLSALLACENHAHQPEPASPPQPERTMTSAPKQQTRITGTIEYKNLEGGFYALEAKNGQSYLLMGLGSDYQRHGLVVEVTGEAKPDLITFQQYGTPFKVVSVTIIDDSNARKTNADQL